MRPPTLPRWQEALAACVLVAAMFVSPPDALADIARARKLAATAMTHFQQKKYMASVRFHGQAIGALPHDKAHKERAHSLFYIGLCYHRLKYRSHAVGAWKRFLTEIKKVPGAESDASWKPRIQLAKAVVAGGAGSTGAAPGDPDPSDPPPAVRKPPAKRDVEPPPGQRSAIHQKPTPSGDWLGEVRRCLRKRPKSTKAAIRRLHFCRSQMPQGSACNNKCRALKKRILRKAQQLERGLPPSDDPRDRWHGEPPAKGQGNRNGYGRAPHGDPGGGYDGNGGRGGGGAPRPRPVRLQTIGTITFVIAAGVGALGVGLYFVGREAASARNELMGNTPSAANTSAIVSKHGQAEAMYMGSLISISLAAVGLSVGSILYKIGRTTDHMRYHAQAPAPKRSRRVTLLSTGATP